MISPEKRLPTDYTVKYTFTKPTFSTMDIKGSIIDEICETRGFNEDQIAEGIADNIIFTKSKTINEPIQKYLEVTKEYIRFMTSVGEGLPYTSFDNINFILNKIGVPACKTLGVATTYSLFVKDADLQSIKENFFNFNNLNLSKDKKDIDLAMKSHYTTTFSVGNIQINVLIEILDYQKKKTEMPNIRLMLDYIIMKNVEFKEKTIKEALDYSIMLANNLGFEIK